MKFKSLHLKAYGLFTDLRLSLSVNPGVVNVVHGPNERGKSTTRRAARDLLYGFPHNTDDAFLHVGRELRVGGDLLLPSGEIWTVYRRKGRKDTLADVAGTPVNEYPLASILGGVERGGFERMFALDSEQLRAGGREILNGQGEAGPIIFQAGAGLIAFNRARNSFEDDAAGQFRGRSGALVAALSRYRESLEKVRTATLSGERWASERRELDGLSVRLGDLARRRYEVDGRRTSVERIRRHLPQLARRVDLLEERRALGAVPDLQTEAREERQKAQRELDRNSVELRTLSDELGRFEALIERLKPDLSVLKARDEISSVPDRRGAALQDRDDLIRRQGESQRLRAELSEFLKEWGYEVEVEAAEDLVPSRTSVALIRALISEGARLAEQIEGNQADAGRFRAEADEAEQALADLPIARDFGRAADLIHDVVSRGALEKTLSEKVQSHEREQAALELAVKRLGLWGGSASDLAAAALPSVKTIEGFVERYKTLGERREELRGAIKHLQDQIVGYRNRITRLQTGGSVITEAHVAGLRDRRNQGWSLVRRGYIDTKQDIMAEAAAFDPDLTLADAYEESVGDADKASDELMAQASQSAEFKTISVEIALADAKREELHRELGEVEVSIKALEGDWFDHWRGWGIKPLSPTEMKEWVGARNRIVERVEALDREQDSIQSLRAEINACQRFIEDALNDLGVKPEETTLSGGVERAQVALRTARELSAKREKVVAAIEAARRVQREKEQIVARLQLAIADWHKRWTEAVMPLGCAPDANPTQIGALINGLEQVREKLNTYQGLLRRIDGIKERIAAFEQGVNELAMRLMPQLVDTPPLKLAQRLIDELSAAEGIEQERARAEDGKSRCTRRIAELKEDCAQHRLTLERLCRAAGCTDPKDLEEIEQRAARSRELTKELDDINRGLVQDGDGLKIDELVKEAEEKSADDVCGELSQLAVQLEDLDKERQQLSESKGALENQLRSYDGSEAAALAAQQAECELATAANAAREYVRARVATAVLSRAVERFSLEHQAPILRIAADFFRRLTVDKYLSLIIEPNEDDRLELVAVKPDGTKVSVVGLSDGARDQLYLALRIAAILDYLDRHEALPVIADDLLISFDDDRSAAALEILSELSMRTQVVVFTHHSYVVQTAQRVLGPDRVSVVELGETAVENGRAQAA